MTWGKTKMNYNPAKRSFPPWQRHPLKELLKQHLKTLIPLSSIQNEIHVFSWSCATWVRKFLSTKDCFVGSTLTGHQQTDLCYPDEVGDDSCSLWGGWLAEHHELNPLWNAVEEGDETLQDGVVHGAAVHHKAVVVLKLNKGGSVCHLHTSIFILWTLPSQILKYILTLKSNPHRTG